MTIRPNREKKPTEAEIAREIIEQQPENINRLFLLWKDLLDWPRATLTPNRKKKLGARLKRYSVADLESVLRIAANDPSTRGQNRFNRPYDDIMNIFRNDERVEMYLRMGASRRSMVSDL